MRPRTVMALHPSTRPAGVGSGSEETPISERITLTPAEDDFLNSEPAYDREEVETVPAPPVSLPPGPVTELTSRRLGSLLAFSLIVGSASLVLGLAVLRTIGHALLH